ncbi:hypothetical protein QA995_42915 [Streptomyces scabiei]|uniref:hypothetical protein n=1 Tax=Streptomyces scabiei TaxID=1930 RepID=UPI001FF0ED47|nr:MULTISPECIES: hypothetical protein [Streptomyces]MDX2871572.1 hypothetical protein [Streptomyces scabiei]MDX3449312.1 hypothetical protein [Streptomyces scabiei]MDX3463266.1 hypothetical protein [Streptomyces scabiei]
MPKKTGTENPYGYDPETNTVRVGQHDLARLLLMFRTLMSEQEPGRWRHMDDFDLSFERLADAVDAAAETRQGKRWAGPDLRMRCTTTEAAYAWPKGAPYDGGTPVTWKVPGYDSHAVAEGSRRRTRSLCGFSWAQEEGRAVDGLPECPECLREVQLGAERPYALPPG